jgi:uncharacterized integral membrane protein
MFFLVLILFLIVGSALTIVTIQNLLAPPVHVIFFTWQTPSLPAGLVVLFSFLLGALLLYLVSTLSAWRDKREITRLERQVRELEQRLTVTTQGMPAPPVVGQGGTQRGMSPYSSMPPMMPMAGEPVHPQKLVR